MEAERWTVAELADRARNLITPGNRKLLGITGPPGAGKSTLAGALVEQLDPHAALVPMDGFHLSRARLAELGRLERMGAVDTFDADGYVATIERLRTQHDQPVTAPAFDRSTESAIPDAIEVRPDTPLVITEGNYLLIDREPWRHLRSLLDEIWFVDPGATTRLQRLIARHTAYGKTPDQARAWSLGPDEQNARLIDATRAGADLIVTIED